MIYQDPRNLIIITGALHNMWNMILHIISCTLKLNFNVLKLNDNLIIDFFNRRFQSPCNTSFCSLCFVPSWMPCTIHVHVYIKILKLHKKKHKITILKKLLQLFSNCVDDHIPIDDSIANIVVEGKLSPQT